MLDIGASNLDLVRSIYAERERGDFSHADWAHPEIESVQADGPDTGTATGLADMARTHRDFLSAWDEWRVEAEDYLELDRGRAHRPRETSGMEVGHVRTKGASLFYVRGGQVTRLVQYFDRDRALADLGLTE